MIIAALALVFVAKPTQAQEPVSAMNSGQGIEISDVAADAAARSENQEGNAGDDKRIGSPYVELDSWVYPALDRLAALGYIHSDFADTRPWTRIECAHMVLEAGNTLATDASASSQVEQLLNPLEKEFQKELNFLNGSGQKKRSGLTRSIQDRRA